MSITTCIIAYALWALFVATLYAIASLLEYLNS